VPGSQDEMDADFAASAPGGVRGVRSGVDSVAAGAAAGAEGAALRVLRVVLKARDAVRVSGWAVIWRAVSPGARRRHVRQIMVCGCGWELWLFPGLQGARWRVAGWNWSC
jgi:hypothetical protein